MHSTVPGAVRLGLEPRFAYWPVARDEEGHRVRGARLRGDLHLRIREGARSPRGRLCMTAGAAIQVEPRSEAGFRTGYDCLPLDPGNTGVFHDKETCGSRSPTCTPSGMRTDIREPSAPTRV